MSDNLEGGQFMRKTTVRGHDFEVRSNGGGLTVLWAGKNVPAR